MMALSVVVVTEQAVRVTMMWFDGKKGREGGLWDKPGSSLVKLAWTLIRLIYSGYLSRAHSLHHILPSSVCPLGLGSCAQCRALAMRGSSVHSDQESPIGNPFDFSSKQGTWLFRWGELRGLPNRILAIHAGTLGSEYW